MRKTLVRANAVLLALVIATRGADLSSSGNWVETINSSDLAAGAGSNLNSQYESSSGSTMLTILNTAGASWRILARRSDGAWLGSFMLSVRRTSDGSGAGPIVGGSSYIQLSTLDTEICSGTGDRSNIAVQYSLSGMSKTVAPNTYNSGIIFTLFLQ